MAIKSIQRIELVEPTGQVTRLLDYGQKISELISVPVEQGVRHGAPTRGLWAKASPTGVARGEMAWARIRDHASHADVHGFCQRHGALMPILRPGVLRVSILDGEVWDHLDAVVTACVPVPLRTTKTFESITQYRVEVGEKLPVSGLVHEVEHPISWGLDDIEDCTYLIGGLPSGPGVLENFYDAFNAYDEPELGAIYSTEEDTDDPALMKQVAIKTEVILGYTDPLTIWKIDWRNLDTGLVTPSPNHPPIPPFTDRPDPLPEYPIYRYA